MSSTPSTCRTSSFPPERKDRRSRIQCAAQQRARRSMTALNDLPIKTVNGATIYIRDVGKVRDGFPPQTNIVRVDGQRAPLLTVLKTGNASTLDIITQREGSSCRASIDQLASRAADHADLRPIDLRPRCDQWRGARGDHRRLPDRAHDSASSSAVGASTIIIAVSIPLSIICSLIIMRPLGQTINIMTLGGLALAVGILVDDATVEIENIHRNLEEGKEVEDAILDGAAQIAVPAFVSTLCHLHCLCADVFPQRRRASISSFRWPRRSSSPCSPPTSFRARSCPRWRSTCSRAMSTTAWSRRSASRNPFVRFQITFEHYFEKLRNWYHGVLGSAWNTAPSFWSRSSRSGLSSARALSVAGPGLLPVGGRRPVQAARARPHRHAH